MQEFLIPLGIFLVAFLMMAIGAIFGRCKIKGSCGGIGSQGCMCENSKKKNGGNPKVKIVMRA